MKRHKSKTNKVEEIEVLSTNQREVKKMPDYNSRKKLEKKVIDRWENEGGNHSPYEGKLKTVNLPCKGKQTKNRHRQAANKNENL